MEILVAYCVVANRAKTLTMTKKLRILYAAGPGDVIGTYSYWNQGQDDPSQVAITFSGQFYQLCSDLDAEGYIISSHPKQQFLQDGRFTLEHRPVPLLQQAGVLYHLGQIWYGLGLIMSALWFRADAVVVSDSSHYFVMSLLPKLGIQVIPSLHCTLWQTYLPLSKTQQLLLKLNQNFFAKDCLAILATSQAIVDQVKQITHHQPRPIVNYLSTYRQNEFENIKQPQWDRSPFQVLFAGRIERNKGVFDLLAIAQRFKAEGRENIVFNVCGTGTALEELQRQVIQLELGSTFICHGYCQKEQMRRMFDLAHVVIVPTRSEFSEGLNQVVIEGVLAGRPVITSAVCPALFSVQAAAVEVPPDDVTAYGDAILKLAEDRELYEEKRQNCLALKDQFYNPAHSWAEALKSILVKLL